MGLVGIGAVTVEARVGHWDEDAMLRSFRTRPILNAESQGFTLGWYAVPRRGTGMSSGLKRLCRVYSDDCFPQRRISAIEEPWDWSESGR